MTMFGQSKVIKGFLLAITVIVGLILWLVITTSGARWAINKITTLEPRIALHIQGGTLLQGIRFQSLAWTDTGMQIAVNTGEITWNWGCLRLKHCVASADIDGLEVRLLPTQMENLNSADDAHLPLALPFSDVAFTARIQSVLFQQPEQGIQMSGLDVALLLDNRTLQVIGLDISEIAVVNLPVSDVVTDVPPTQEPAIATDASLALQSFAPFEGPFLPFDVEITDLQVGSIAWDPKIASKTVEQVALAGSWRRNGTVTLDSLAMQHAMGSVSVQGDISLKDRWPLNVVVTAIPDSTKFPDMDLNMTVQGDFDNLQWQVASQGSVNVQGSGNIKLLSENIPVTAQVRWAGLEFPLAEDSTLTSDNGSLTLYGGLLDPDIEFELSSTITATPMSTANDIVIQGAWRQDTLTLDRVALSQPHGELSLTGIVNAANGLTWDLVGQANDFNVENPWLSDIGTINGEFANAGTLSGQDWHTTVSVSDVRVAHRQKSVSFKGDFWIDSAWHWYTDGLELRESDNRITFSGGLQDSWDGAIQVDVPDISGYVTDAAGALQADIAVSGQRDTPLLQLTLGGQNLSWQDISWRRLNVKGDIVASENGLFNVAVSALSGVINDQVIDKVSLQAEGNRKNHRLNLSVTNNSVAGDLSASGGLVENNAWQGKLTSGLVTAVLGQWRLENPATVDVNLGESTVAIGPHCWDQGMSQLCTKEPTHLGVAGTVKASLTQLDVARLVPYLPEGMVLRGALDAQINATWQGNELLQADVDILGHPGAVELREGAVSPITVAYEQWRLSSKKTHAGWQINGEINGPELGNLQTQATFVGTPGLETPLTVTARLSDFSLSVFQGVLTQQFQVPTSASGFLFADLTMVGSADQPELSGRVDLRKGRFQQAGLPVALHDIELALLVNGAHAKVTGQLNVMADNADSKNGIATIVGEGQWAKNDWTADIQLDGQQITVAEQSFQKVGLHFSGGIAKHDITLFADHDFGTAALSLNGGINVDQNWHGKIMTGTVDAAGAGVWHLQSPAALDVNLENTAVTIGPHCWKQSAASLCASKLLTLGDRTDIAIHLSQFDVDAVSAYMPEGLALTGVLDANVSAAWQDGRLLNAHAELIGQPGVIVISNAPRLVVPVAYDHWRLSALHTNAGWQVEGAINGPLLGKLSGSGMLVGDPTIDMPIALTAVLTNASVALFEPIVSSLIEVPTRALGLLSVDMNIDGTLSHPILTGRATLRDGALQQDGMPLSLSEVGLTVLIQQDAASISGAFNVNPNNVADSNLSLKQGSGEIVGEGQWRQGDWIADLQLSGKQVLISEQLVDNFDLHFKGGLASHNVAFSIGHQSGTGSMGLSGGMTNDQQWQGRLKSGLVDAAWGRWQLQQPTPINLDVAQGVLAIDAHCWQFDGSALCSDKTLMLGNSGSLDLSLTKLDLTPLAPYLPQGIALIGSLDATLSAAWQDNALQRADMTLGGQKGEIDISPGQHNAVRFQYDHWQASAQKTSTGWVAHADISGPEMGSFSASATLLGEPSVDAPLTLTSHLADLPIALFAPLFDASTTASGYLFADVNVTGSTLQPSLSGRMSLREGTFQQEGVPVAVEDIQLDVNLEGDSADISGAFVVGQGIGLIKGDGQWRGGEWSTNMTLTGTNMVVQDSQMSFTITPDIRVFATANTLDFKGKILIPSGDIRIKSLPESAVAVSHDVVIQSDGVDVHIPTAVRMTTNVDIELGDAVWFDAYGLKTQLLGNLTVRQDDLSDPLIFGHIETKEGSFKALGARLDIRNGQLIFSGPADRPLLDLTAVRVVGTTVAGITARGIVTSPEITLFSEPSMTQAEILSYIIKGQPIEGSAISEGLLATKVAMGLGIYGGESPLAQMSERLGIEDFNIDAEGTSDSARIALGGFVSPRLYVKYGVGVMNAANEFTLRYRLLPRLFLESVTSINTGLDLIYAVEF